MRMHALKMSVLAEPRDGGAFNLRAPSPGKFWPNIDAGARVAAGQSIGTLDVLGRSFQLMVPAGVVGHAGTVEPRNVVYGETLLELTPGATVDVEARAQTTSSVSGLVFRAPTSGRFYGRAAPGKPPFVEVGTELGPGATICLLEVMKTFHRVHYGGDGLPERARVRDVLVKDGDDVNAGDALLALDAI